MKDEFLTMTPKFTDKECRDCFKEHTWCELAQRGVCLDMDYAEQHGIFMGKRLDRTSLRVHSEIREVKE